MKTHVGTKRAGCGRAGKNAALTMNPHEVTCQECKPSYLMAIAVRDYRDPSEFASKLGQDMGMMVVEPKHNVEMIYAISRLLGSV